MSNPELYGQLLEFPVQAIRKQPRKGNAALDPESATARRTLLKAESDERLLDRITDIWNAWADRHGSPKVICLTAQRGIKCRRRIQDLLRLGYATPDAAFQFLLSKADESFFVLGNPSRPLNFDQLMNESFMTKLIEDTYKHRTQGRR